MSCNRIWLSISCLLGIKPQRLVSWKLDFGIWSDTSSPPAPTMTRFSYLSTSSRTKESLFPIKEWSCQCKWSPLAKLQQLVGSPLAATHKCGFRIKRLKENARACALYDHQEGRMNKNKVHLKEAISHVTSGRQVCWPSKYGTPFALDRIVDLGTKWHSFIPIKNLISAKSLGGILRRHQKVETVPRRFKYAYSASTDYSLGKRTITPWVVVAKFLGWKIADWKNRLFPHH